MGKAKRYGGEYVLWEVPSVEAATRTEAWQKMRDLVVADPVMGAYEFMPGELRCWEAYGPYAG